MEKYAWEPGEILIQGPIISYPGTRKGTLGKENWKAMVLAGFLGAVGVPAEASSPMSEAHRPTRMN